MSGVSLPPETAALKRVLTVGPMPPEKLAYALARYSRSPDSIRDSLAWVQSHDSAKFLESFYFQYGHASIADLGHLAICFEGISELAATEIEDEQLWDGQARSSRYQDFSRLSVVVPPEFDAGQRSLYQAATSRLLDAYRAVHVRALERLRSIHVRPDGMKPEAYERNLNARAFDVARYLLPLGIPTGVGQVTSIRTLERQMQRLHASPFSELRELATELQRACGAPAECVWSECFADEPVAPTLARHGEPAEFSRALRETLAAWAKDHLPTRHETPPTTPPRTVDLLHPADHVADICATLLYPVTDRPYRFLYELVRSWSDRQRKELLALALEGRQRRDELPRHFRSAPYVFDITMDIGAYRDLHRHRRCQQFRQEYTDSLGYEIPALVDEADAGAEYHSAISAVRETFAKLPQPGAQYVLPFAMRSRFLFKMDFPELEYIARLRSGVKGHFSYRKIAWEMKLALDEFDPMLGQLVRATPPWIEDPLQR